MSSSARTFLLRKKRARPQSSPSPFSAKLAQILQYYHLSQKKVAALCGVQQGAVSKWLHGLTTPSNAALQLLASRLKPPVPMAWLHGGPDQPLLVDVLSRQLRRQAQAQTPEQEGAQSPADVTAQRLPPPQFTGDLNSNLAMFEQLPGKDAANLEVSLKLAHPLFVEGVRRITTWFQLTQKLKAAALTPLQHEILSFFFERILVYLHMTLQLAIYAEGTTTVGGYVILRQVLELGVSVVYYWDLPHLFWRWKNHQETLPPFFPEMAEHLDSPDYRGYVAALQHKLEASALFDAAYAWKLYCQFNSVIHGKEIPVFEARLPGRFSYSGEEWETVLLLTNEVVDLVLHLWQARFPDPAEPHPTVPPQRKSAQPGFPC